MTATTSRKIWAGVAQQLEGLAEGARLAFAKPALPHPREAGALVSVGLPVGQVADFRFAPDSACRGMHVQEYQDRWVVHMDQVHPWCDVLEHLRRDAPNAWCASGAVLGAAVGAALGRSSGAALAGAGIGLLIALASGEQESAR